MKIYKMKCGHTANATIRNNKTGIETPACVICSCTDVEREVEADEGLEGRQARCGQHTNYKNGRDIGDGIRPSRWDLAFFKYRGPGSEDAETVCKVCGYRKCAHEDHEGRINVVKEGKCTGFVPHGPFEYDEYYCGCHGWD